MQLLTAIVKLFLKRPTETQELVQQVLSLATQDSDNPDLRDRGFIYWRLLSTDPVAAKEVVLAEKPLINEETDLLEPTLLDELICHIGSLASVYHKPPSAFVEGKFLSTILKLYASKINYTCLIFKKVKLQLLENHCLVLEKKITRTIMWRHNRKLQLYLHKVH